MANMSDNEKTITEADNGRAVEMRRGDSVVVQLHEPSYAGYSWSMDKPNLSIIRALEGAYIRDMETIGHDGHVRWRLRALRRGKAQIRFKLWRKLDGEPSVKNRFTATLIVRS
jgi:predicted secreted protein